MAQTSSHSHSLSSSNQLPTLSSVARTRADVAQRLVDDLRLHNDADPDGTVRLCAVLGVLLHGVDAELDRDELEHLLRLDVPRALVAGDTQER